MLAFAAMFSLGYMLATSSIQQCSAQVSGGGCNCCNVTCTDVCVVYDVDGVTCLSTSTSCTTCPPQQSCEPSGIAGSLTAAILAKLAWGLERLESKTERWLTDYLTITVQGIWLQIDLLEQDMIDWWRTMWWYGWRPGLQAMTRQLNDDLALQNLMQQGAADATGELEVKRALEKHAVDDFFALAPPGEQICIAATGAGGYGRASNLARYMRQAWENESVSYGLNEKGRPDTSTAEEGNTARYEVYRTLFCDPQSNNGKNNCGPSDPDYYGADAMPVKYLFNRLTIDVDDDPKMDLTIKTILENMMGRPISAPIVKPALQAAEGKETFLDRRSYLARYAASRTAPDLIAGWRMPGSQLKDSIAKLRESVGVAPDATSDNPSYKEIMHAISVDRFNTGYYATWMITDENKVEMEKLSLSVFYLMQLRDYYELLERTALTLAVQVSMYAEPMPMPKIEDAEPIK